MKQNNTRIFIMKPVSKINIFSYSNRGFIVSVNNRRKV